MKPYKVHNQDSMTPIIVTCEHASSTIPRQFGTMGLDRKSLARVSYLQDTGAKDLAKIIAFGLNARCIYPAQSRLIIDTNRTLDSPELFRTDSFGTAIPKNMHLSDDEKEDRIAKYYAPYHNRLKKELDYLKEKCGVVHYISVHSFNQFVNGEERKVDIGILFRYDKDEYFCSTIKRILEEQKDLSVKFNEPYSSKESDNDAIGTIETYGNDKNIRCIEFEVNDKYLKNDDSVRKMGALLLGAVKRAIISSESKTRWTNTVN